MALQGKIPAKKFGGTFKRLYICCVNQNTSNMETQEAVKTQTVSKANTVIAQNTAKAEKLISKANDKKAPAEKSNEKQKKEPKPRPESNEAMALRLYKEKASQEAIVNAFTAVYKQKKGVTDKKFIESRAAIYMRIAEKKAAAKMTK